MITCYAKSGGVLLRGGSENDDSYPQRIAIAGHPVEHEWLSIEIRKSCDDDNAAVVIPATTAVTFNEGIPLTVDLLI